MTGEDYLKQLRARLTGRTDPAELERLMCYYTDYFEEAGPEGADAVIRELGTPAELTGRILGERHGRYEGNTGAAAQPAAGHRRGPLAWALGLLGAVLIGIPMIALLAGLTIGLAAGGFVCVAMGVFVLFSGFSALFTGGLATTMDAAGVGLATCGGGVMLLAAVVALALGGFRGAGRLMRNFFCGRRTAV